MKRLLIITRSSNPRGGVDQIISELCRQLPARGWDVTLGLTRGNQFNLPKLYRREFPDLTSVEIDGSIGTRFARLHALTRSILKHRPDVVLSMRVFDAYEAVARIKQRHSEYQPRLVVGVRSFEEGYLGDVRRYCGVIDGCITSGKLIASACTTLCGLEPERVNSIAGGVMKPNREVMHLNVHAPVRLLYAGRLDQIQKRARDLVLFVQALSRKGLAFRLDIAGDGSEMDFLRRELKPWVDRNEIYFHGWIGKQSLYRDLYPNSDILVHFASWEGVTIAPREAMAHGMVPVISRFTGLKSEGQFIHDHNALTFPVGDTETAAAHILRLVNNPELFKRLSSNAATSQQGEYSAAGAMDKWDTTLRNTLALRPMSGEIPTIDENLTGRLSRIGLPPAIQTRLRSLFHLPVRHADAGSEWPTTSGLLTESERQEFSEFARFSEHE